MTSIRHATEADLSAVLAIFNHAVMNSTAVWIDAPVTLEDRRAWHTARCAQGYPVLVADETGVQGFGSFGDFRPYDGFRNTVEHSIYVLETAQGRGIGRALLAALIEEARRLDKRVMVGAIDATNGTSLALHETMGFHETGRMPGVGEKFGRRLDMVLVQLSL